MTTETDSHHLDTIFELLMESTPEDTELLLIGGFALELWVAEYYDKHSELFKGVNFVRTKDFDFCMKDKDNMKICSGIWCRALNNAGYETTIITPTMDDHTPEAMVINIEHPDSFQTQIDLFFNVHGLSKGEIWTQPEQKSDSLFILSEIMTFYSRAWNVATLPSKQNKLSIMQLKQSISVIHASILTKLDSDKTREALNLVKKVVSLVNNKKIDSPLMRAHGIDLLASIPANHPVWPEKFKTIGYPKMIEPITKSRARYK